MAYTTADLKALRKEAEILEKSHGGYAGKSLIEKIRDDLDTVVDELQYGITELESGLEYKQGLADGIAHALGVLTSSSMESEFDESSGRVSNLD